MSERELDLVAFGETMALVSSNQVGSLSLGGLCELRVGGAESNVAIAASRLGERVAWYGCVGADPLGELVVQTIRGQGVLALVDRDPTRPTGLMVKERRTPRHQRVYYYRADSAGSALKPNARLEQAIRSAHCLHVSGVSLALSMSARQTVDWAIETARAAGTQVSFDINYRSALWDAESAVSVFRSVIARSDILFASFEEAAMVLGQPSDPSDMAEALTKYGPRIAVVKAGAKGAFAASVDESSFCSAFEIEVSDTVGAGDAFVAGFLTARRRGLHLYESLELGCKLGAFACMSTGDWEGSPTWDELELLQSNDPVSR